MIGTRWLVGVALALGCFTGASAGDARDLKGLHKGAPVPDALVNRIVAADDPVAEGIAVSASVMRELRDVPGVSGINLRYSGDPRNAVAVIEQARS